METNQVNLWLSVNAEYFNPNALVTIKDKLEKIGNDQFILIQSASFQKPLTILLIAILLGWERFWLDDIGLGILKILTCYGCGIWWIIDIFTAKERAQKYNLQQFMKITSFVQ